MDALLAHGATTPAPVFAPVSLPRKPLVTNVLKDGFRTGLAMPFFSDAKAFARERSGAWHSGQRMWVFSEAKFGSNVRRDLRRLIASLPTFDCDELDALCALASQHVRQDLFVSLLDVQLMPLQQGTWACLFRYDDVLVQAMRTLRGRWHKPANCWELPQSLDQIMAALAQYAGVTADDVFVHDQVLLLEDLTVATGNAVSLGIPGAPVESLSSSDRVLGDDDDGAGYLTARTAARAIHVVDPETMRKAAERFGLYDYQRAGVHHLLSQSGALLADDMGLGKTRQSIVAAHLATPANEKILVVCPASLRINWQREIMAVMSMQPDPATPVEIGALRVAVIGENESATLRESRWHVCTYERLGAVARDVETSYAVMMIDEAHFLKEPAANRTRNAFIVASRIGRRYLLTGTPVLNRESEIHTLLRLSGHAVGEMLIGDFVDAYVGSAPKRIALGEAIQGWLLRRKKDVLKHLPGKLREEVYYAPDEGLDRYHSLLDDDSLPPLARIGKLRQMIEELKIPAVLERINALGRDDKVLVFCEYTDTIARLGSALNDMGVACVSVTGSDSIAARQKAVDAFQQNTDVRVFLGTSGAAGVGLNLTAANWVIFSGLPWTPAMKNQAEDRAFRNGQTRKVTVYTPIVAGTIDEQLHALLASKQAIADDVLSTGVSEQEMKAALLRQLVH
jgi:superfamily II DNA or RNA helicase